MLYEKEVYKQRKKVSKEGMNCRTGCDASLEITRSISIPFSTVELHADLPYMCRSIQKIDKAPASCSGRRRDSGASLQSVSVPFSPRRLYLY